MTVKAEKLQTRIQEIQKLVSTNLERDKRFKTIFQELEKIAANLRTEQLKLQLVSNNLIAARSLQTYFEQHNRSQYQIKVNSLPTQLEPLQPVEHATLVLSKSNFSKI